MALSGVSTNYGPEALPRDSSPLGSECNRDLTPTMGKMPSGLLRLFPTSEGLMGKWRYYIYIENESLLPSLPDGRTVSGSAA